MIAQNLQKVRAQIDSTLQEIGDPQRQVKLVVVSKTHAAEVVDQALLAGAQFLGENKVQEALQKLPLLQQPYGEFHFIGHLQSNKINKLLSLEPTLIHSLDKLSTAEKLSKALQKLGKEQDVLLQVNTSGEESKSGLEPEQTLEMVEKISRLPHLQVKGLMTIGALDPDPEASKRCFLQLKELFEQAAQIDSAQMKWLSMGMSGDYRLALRCGANLLRVGSSIFGARDYSL